MILFAAFERCSRELSGYWKGKERNGWTLDYTLYFKDCRCVSRYHLSGECGSGGKRCMTSIFFQLTVFAGGSAHIHFRETSANTFGVELQGGNH